MRQTIPVIPDPVSLIESMRAIGYSTNSAVADIIDNSISANANQISVEYGAANEPFVAILDNGIGMNTYELTNAMRLGSSNPNDIRESHDLGRFGLGLKTASLSQCRKLTVVSKKNGDVNSRCWDLDYVQRNNQWVVVVATQEELELLPLFQNLTSQSSGTLVVWQSLDRMMSGSENPHDEMKMRMKYLQDHLSFVFHRFTQKEEGLEAIDILVNGVKLYPVDPFLSKNSYTQILEGQPIRVGGAIITVQPFVLPHMSHLNPDDVELAGGRDGLRSNQGFYIYRNRRLVIWGTWFRLVPKEEFYKLTRVKVDIPNSLDHLWALDIKKSAAYPPDIIRNRLKELIPHFANTSRTTITYPGRKQKNNTFIPLWERVEPSHGTFRYEINTDHPGIRSITDSLGIMEQKNLQVLFELLASALPLESIYSDLCSDKRRDSYAESIKELLSIARNLIEITDLDLETVLSLDPLARFPQHHAQIKKEITE